MSDIFDLQHPDHAYLFGFVQCDGTLRRGPGRKGRLSIELSAIDADHLRELAAVIPARSSLRFRTRDTNFKRAHTSCVLDVFDLSVREDLRRLGMPEGRKSAVIAPPSVPYSESDYFRGVIDADGSLGLDRRGLPFVSLCTSSPPLAAAFGAFVAEVSGQRKRVHANARDRAFNVMCWNERAQDVVAALYTPGALALPRKAARARCVLAWSRPPTLGRRPRRDWTPAEDAVALAYPLEEAMEVLGRSAPSVSQRVRRLRTGKGLSDAA